MEIVPYSSAHRDAIERMNMTLQAAGSEWQFPPEERPANADQLPVWMESFIAVDRDAAYGGYLLKHQQFFAGGRPLEVGDLQMPLSMGQIDGSYAHFAAALFATRSASAPRRPSSRSSSAPPAGSTGRSRSTSASRQRIASLATSVSRPTDRGSSSC